MAKKTNEKFVEELHNINPFIIPLTVYDGAHKVMKFRCSICGQEYEAKPYRELLRIGNGCRKCSYLSAGKIRRKDSGTFAQELKVKNPNVTLLTPYITNKQKVKCKCNLCNHIWETTPDKLLQGIGCPNCYHSATSFIEQFIYLSLREALGETTVLSRNKTVIGRELDIYIPSLKLAIEYGSWYWHKKRVKKDNEKRELCCANGIRLISIYDSCKNDVIETNTDVLVFKQDLSQEKDYTTIKQFVATLCNENGLNSSVLEDKWDDIINLAYQQSRRLTTEGFAKLVKEKNTHNIEIIGEYKSSYDPIRCRCMDCGYEWSPRPNNLLNENAGCPQCSGNRHYTNAEFTSMVALANPNFELLEPFKRNDKSILCRCKKCGYRWKASPVNLLEKRAGCPKCTGHKKYTTDEFYEKMRLINPNVTLLEPYPVNNKTKILCLCNNCGNRFSMRPNNLLSGQGCPVCGAKNASQKRIKSDEDFRKELALLSPDIIAKSPYINSKYKIECQCKVCGNKWKATPNSLLRGYGCPVCSRKKASEKNKRKVLCIETNSVYESLKEAALQSGLSKSVISMCCTGKRDTAGGLHWKYIEQKEI
ncbi:MAG: hypothetical protein K6F23_13315 [Solobacterium sp.]|nr:hypothetical protein [Solobacterium sp.]